MLRNFRDFDVQNRWFSHFKGRLSDLKRKNHAENKLFKPSDLERVCAGICNNSSTETKELRPINLENTSWLTNIDNEFQALVGFGACVAQSVMGIAQSIGQSEIMCAKINAETALAKIKVENEGRLQTAMLEKESQIIASTMPIFQEEIKRLGARIDSLNAIILEKYSAIDLSQTQQKERDNLEKLIEHNQKQLDNLLQHVMAQAKA